MKSYGILTQHSDTETNFYQFPKDCIPLPENEPDFHNMMHTEPIPRTQTKSQLHDILTPYPHGMYKPLVHSDDEDGDGTSVSPGQYKNTYSSVFHKIPKFTHQMYMNCMVKLQTCPSVSSRLKCNLLD